MCGLDSVITYIRRNVQYATAGQHPIQLDQVEFLKEKVAHENR